MKQSHIIFLVVIVIIVVVGEIFLILLNLVAGGGTRGMFFETRNDVRGLVFRPLVQLLTFIIPSVININRIIKHSTEAVKRDK
jgi:hypothetical protein